VPASSSIARFILGCCDCNVLRLSFLSPFLSSFSQLLRPVLFCDVPDSARGYFVGCVCVCAVNKREQQTFNKSMFCCVPRFFLPFVCMCVCALCGLFAVFFDGSYPRSTSHFFVFSLTVVVFFLRAVASLFVCLLSLLF